MKKPISIADFTKLDLAIGTVISARLNQKARKPAYILEVDFGERGIKTTSAQLTENYQPEDLINRQVIAVMNFPPLKVAGVKSEVLVLAGVSDTEGTVLLSLERPMPNGTPVS